MAAWWQSLTALEHILLYIAVPATLVLIIQTVLLFAGGVFDSDGAGEGDGGLDHDGLDHDGFDHADSHFDVGGHDAPPGGDGSNLTPDHSGGPDSGLHLFTVRGVVAFLVLFGWGGLCLCQVGMPGFLAVFLAVPIGFAGMVGIALAVRQAVRLQYDGTLDLRNAVGLAGQVYLTVPPARTGEGKVMVTVQEQLRELDARTDSTQPIPTGSAVRVTGLAGRDILLVEPAPASSGQQEKQEE